jgi:hypothetical protein
MKKTIKKAVPLVLFLFIPYFNLSNLNAKNKNVEFESFVLDNPESSLLKAQVTGNIIVRNIIRK